jgi:hypothetical protein
VPDQVVTQFGLQRQVAALRAELPLELTRNKG